MNNFNSLTEIRESGNCESLYRLLAAHSLGEKARGLSCEEKAQYALANILRFQEKV